jgi:hypothetical protein
MIHDTMNVGSTIRARRRIRRSDTIGSNAAITTSNGTPKSFQYVEITQRAVIATIDGHNNNISATSTTDSTNTTACIIWESIIPQPISINESFIITPKSSAIDVTHGNDDGEETIVPLEQLVLLHPFEMILPPLFTDISITTNTIENIQLWKECGDTLYQIHDVVAAIPYYEHALYLSCNCNQYQVGTTIFLKDSKGYIVTAEIDCIDMNEDDEVGPTYDITITETDEERTIRRNDILFSILSLQEEMPPASHSNNSSNDIQVRILLNLSRCLLQYVDLVSGVANNNNDPKEIHEISIHKEKFCKSVVLATSLALAMIKRLGMNADVDTISKFETSALLLRSRAQCQLKNKMKHAIMDLQKISSNNKEAQQLLRQIQMHQKQVTKTNQRLAKNVSQWIQTTLQSTDNGPNNDKYDVNTTSNKVCTRSIKVNGSTETTSVLSVSSSLHESKSTNTPISYHYILRSSIPVLFIIIIAVVVRWMMGTTIIHNVK